MGCRRRGAAGEGTALASEVGRHILTVTRLTEKRNKRYHFYRFVACPPSSAHEPAQHFRIVVTPQVQSQLGGFGPAVASHTWPS